MTAREHALISFADTERKEAVEPFTNYFIGRIKQDFNNGKTVLEAMGTSTYRNIKDAHLNTCLRIHWLAVWIFSTTGSTVNILSILKVFSQRLAGAREAITALQLNSRHLFQREDAGHLEFDPDLRYHAGMGRRIQGR
jgi:hypothetical protein